jgi:MerR family transcriptional regulator, copper efflux regulator
MRTVRHLPVATHYSRAPQFPMPVSLDSGVGLRSDALGDEPPDLPDLAEDGERLLQVGDIAKASGKTVRAIHHYEEVGLLQPHARSKGRYRLYDQASVNRVRWIGKLHDLGLSLSEIQEMVKAWEGAPSAPNAMARIRAIYLTKLEETRAQIAHLSSLQRELAASIDYLDTCDSACDPAELVRACMTCDLHDRSRPEPELVAGIHGGQSQRKPSGHR